MTQENIYLDNAATTPLHPEVLEIITNTLQKSYGNPSSIHGLGRNAKGIIEESRVAIAKHIGCTASEIYFTSCGTEANNLALRMAANSLDIQHIITSPIEHHAVLGTVEDIANYNKKMQLHLLKVDEQGNYSLNELEELLQKHPNALVSLMHANNELGNLANLGKIGTLCKTYNALFHTDAVQTIGYFNYSLNASNIHMLSASAHKFGGPKGIGFLYLKKGVAINSLITGGGQERNLRAGTENVSFIAGMAKAMALCYDNLEEKSAHIKSLKALFMDLLKRDLPQIKFNGNTDNSHYTVLSIRIPIQEGGEMFLFNLDLNGISASGGSACSSGASKGSHVMEAIGNSGNCINVRFSFGVQNTKEEINRSVEILKGMLTSAQA